MQENQSNQANISDAERLSRGIAYSMEKLQETVQDLKVLADSQAVSAEDRVRANGALEALAFILGRFVTADPDSRENLGFLLAECQFLLHRIMLSAQK